MHIKTFFKNLKKRASGSVETAIKVLTAVVLGAAILMGLYGLVTGVVLPSTETAVSSMFAYSAEADGGNGGTQTPTPTPTPATVSFALEVVGYSGSDTLNFEVAEGTTWADFIATNPSFESITNEGAYSGANLHLSIDTNGEVVCGICTVYGESDALKGTDPIIAGTYQCINQ